MSDLVLLERNDNGVGVLRLNNPKVNALSNEVLNALRDKAQEFVDDPPGAVILTGGDRHFAAGADIAKMQGGYDVGQAVGYAFRDACATLEAIPRIVIAEMSGFALGGGLEVALACDMRIAADTAKFGQPEILLGLIPGGGGSQRLPRLIGAAKAKELILTGRQIDADEALRLGVVSSVVPSAELADTVMETAAGFAQGPVVAHGLAKAAIDQGIAVSLAEGIALENELFAQVFETEDSVIGVASFLEHGPGKAIFKQK